MKYLKKAYIGISWLNLILFLLTFFYYSLLLENRGHSDGMEMAYYIFISFILFFIGCFLTAHSRKQDKSTTKLAWAIFASLGPFLTYAIILSPDEVITWLNF